MTSLGLPHGSRYVLHVGTLQPRKNLGRLVQAFAGVLETVPDVHLVLVGKRGWGDEDLGRLARTLGVAERVLTPGYLPREMLPAVYSGAAAVLIPSLYEGFGLPALEAMACGTPVACSSTSSLPEVVGDAGLLFDPLDTDAIGRAMLRLLEDDSLRARMSHEGRARAALFTWERCARSTLAVIDGVLAGKDLRQT
jgi:glycosyltransferase involved in cell wall biosynthesis